MNSPEVIKSALCHCSKNKGCAGCVFDIYDECAVTENALAYIQKLEERIDLMLIQMRGDCGTCRFRLTTSDICIKCMNAGDDPYHPHWEYEGLPGEDTKHAQSV